MGLKIKFLYTKNTIYKNKFCAINHTTKAIIRYMPKLKMWMPPFDVIKYKKEYYQKNKDVYTDRNRNASEQRTLRRIELLSTDEIIYKLKVILEN